MANGNYATLLMTSTLELKASLDGMPVAFRPGHDEILTAKNNALLHYSTDGAPLGEIPCPDPSDTAWNGTFSPDGAAMAIVCERSLWVRERDGDRPRVVERSSSSLGISQVALDDRGYLVAGHWNGELRIWDRSRASANAAAPTSAELPGHLLPTQRRHDAPISGLEVRGDTVFTFSGDQTLRQWTLPLGAPRARAYVRFDNAVMSPNGLWIATVVNTSPDVRLWDSSKARLLARFPTAKPVFRVTFLDDDHVLVASQDGYLEVIDVSGPQRTAREVIRLVRDSSRQRVADERTVEHL